MAVYFLLLTWGSTELISIEISKGRLKHKSYWCFLQLFKKNVRRTDVFCPHEVKNIKKTQGFPMICQHASAQIVKNISRTDDLWPHERKINEKRKVF